MRIVCTGLIGQYPFGGVIWDYIQYLLGFKKLGHEVYYLEDSGTWPYDPIKQTITDDCSYHTSALQTIFSDFDLDNQWIYRNAADGKFHGAGEQLARDLLKNADLLVNVSTASWLRDYDIGVRHQMFIDGDPMFTQIGLLDSRNADYNARLRAHDSHFSFGLNIASSDSAVPDTGIRWMPTLQPIALEHWETPHEDSPAKKFPNKLPEALTTVMNWSSYAPKKWQGKTYGQKNIQFEKYQELPQKCPTPFIIAMGQGLKSQRPTHQLQNLGWEILEPDEYIPDHRSYRHFLTHSHAEWSIAKHGYVEAKTGWFSCRSACYLAAGKPAILEDTGWSKHLPSGKGLLTFHDMNSCLEALDKVKSHYQEHSHAAKEFAKTHLDAEIVCQKLLTDAHIL